MKCYSYLKIDDWEIISDKVYNFVINKTDIFKNKHSWNNIDHTLLLNDVPELKTAIDALSLEIQNIVIIFVKPHSQGRVHVDKGIGIRALFPIKSCQGSFTKFFEVNKEEIVFVQDPINDRGSFYHVPDSAVIKEIDSVETIKPFIFDPQIPHGIYTNPKFNRPRITMTISFTQPPVEL